MLLAELTWPEVDDLDRSRSVLLLPLGAIEAHGPHLPLGTDVVIAEAMTTAAVERLEEQGMIALVLPTVSYSAAPFAAAFPGTVSVPADATEEILVAIAATWDRHQFPILALANAHFDPAHVGAIRAAVTRIEADEEISIDTVFPDLTRRHLAQRLTAEFRSGACHAGQYESSIVLAARPELVREEIARDLSPHLTSLSAGIGTGKATFHELGGDQAYFGDPAAATAAEGRDTIERLGEILVEAVLTKMSA